jgi:hypothetical protein
MEPIAPFVSPFRSGERKLIKVYYLYPAFFRMQFKWVRSTLTAEELAMEGALPRLQTSCGILECADVGPLASLLDRDCREVSTAFIDESLPH